MKSFFWLIALFIIGSGCREDNEVPSQYWKESPDIQIVSSIPVSVDKTICGQKNKVYQVKTKDTLHLNFKITDNAGLSQYKIDIHHNFDCHGHRVDRIASSPWFLIDINNISGKEVNVTRKLVVPENAAVGFYHLIIYCIDSDGNEAEKIIQSISVVSNEDEIPPVVELTNPDTQLTELKLNEELIISGKVRDNSSLESGRIELVYFDSSNTEYSYYQLFLSGKELTQNFSIPFKFPLSAEKGEYTFLLKVYDEKNNFSEKRFYVKNMP